MRIGNVFISLAAAGIVATGCSSQEEPAKAAVANTEAALAQIRDDASKFAPEQLQTTEAKVEGLKTSLAREDYKDVIGASIGVNKEVAALHDVVVAKQTQVAAATNEWEALNEEVPQLVKDIEVRVSSLTGIRLPPDVTKENFEAAKTDLASIKTQWEEATAAFSAGDATLAADKGREVKSKAEDIRGKLAIPAV